ncbi:MAG: GntR family transcriptional regulator [Cyclobacteriaceae bacterium]|nr:GntR family transcriptional regulator [Cyclobacteriaceae bacterium]MCH8515162.1 GntR family transcriptional regulator [Cyclobacteriaceae bacterium]
MIKAGVNQELPIFEESQFGLYLGREDEKVLLPNKFVPESYKLGDLIDVFIYYDSEDRVVATTQTPLIKLNQFAGLVVKENTPIGSFMDWGLDKDLLVPFKEQHVEFREGSKYVVRLCDDPQSNRLIGVSKIKSFFLDAPSSLNLEVKYSALIFSKTPMGYEAVVDQAFRGMLYHDELNKSLNIGDEYQVYIKTVREDGKLDLALNIRGSEQSYSLEDKILQVLDQQDDKVLLLGDKSDPQAIFNQFGVSKKVYKKAIGHLYRKKKIILTDHDIRRP